MFEWFRKHFRIGSVLTLSLALVISTLGAIACSNDDSSAGGEEVATATSSAKEAQVRVDDVRPDAPEYALRGPFTVGFRQFKTSRSSDDALEISSWYPAVIEEGENEEIAYDVVFKDTTWAPAETPVVLGRAVRDAETDGSGGPYPLVVLSHSFAGSTAGYSSLAEHYASHGFIVLAPEHSEQFDEELGDLWKALIDRPADITKTIDFAEELTARDGEMSGRIDMQNVAVVGHSYGGYTALAAAGARFDLEAFNARCDDLSEDDPSTFLCMSLVPNEANMSARAGFDAMPEGLWPAFADPRVTAIVPMAGDAYLFGEAGLAEINIPMMAMGGMSDFGTPYDWGAKPAYEYASSEQKSLVGLVGAEHMIFATPCDRQPWMNDHPANAYYCYDPVWDANRAQDLIHHLSTAFLLDTLKGDPAAHAALLPAAVQFPGIEYTTTIQ